ncbi:unnamed protein product [Amoebophrya sp. A25]|nr:unnamed protein product [Amoebophrya sp. A25]|eukprot:GSA25T00013289001.1
MMLQLSTVSRSTVVARAAWSFCLLLCVAVFLCPVEVFASRFWPCLACCGGTDTVSEQGRRSGLLSEDEEHDTTLGLRGAGRLGSPHHDRADSDAIVSSTTKLWSPPALSVVCTNGPRAGRTSTIEASNKQNYHDGDGIKTGSYSSASGTDAAAHGAGAPWPADASASSALTDGVIDEAPAFADSQRLRRENAKYDTKGAAKEKKKHPEEHSSAGAPEPGSCEELSHSSLGYSDGHSSVGHSSVHSSLVEAEGHSAEEQPKWPTKVEWARRDTDNQDGRLEVNESRTESRGSSAGSSTSSDKPPLPPGKLPGRRHFSREYQKQQKIAAWHTARSRRGRSSNRTGELGDSDVTPRGTGGRGTHREEDVNNRAAFNLMLKSTRRRNESLAASGEEEGGSSSQSEDSFSVGVPATGSLGDVTQRTQRKEGGQDHDAREADGNVTSWASWQVYYRNSDKVLRRKNPSGGASSSRQPFRGEDGATRGPAGTETTPTETPATEAGTGTGQDESDGEPGSVISSSFISGDENSQEQENKQC